MAVVETIELTGFGSYGPTQKLTLGGSGPVAIVGDNGVGKSTAVSKGLTWCLYGKCPPERMGSGTRAIAGRSVVGTNQKKAVVTVTISDQKTVWTVTRERGRSGSDVVRVSRDKVEQEDATQATIDGIVGADYETFCRTVVRGQGDPWSFAEATDGRKREILDAISGAEELEEAWARAKAKRSEAEARAKSAEQAATITKSRLDRGDIEHTQRQLARWEEDQARKVAESRTEIEALRDSAEKAVKQDQSLSDNEERRLELENKEPTLDRKPYKQAVETAESYHRAAYAEYQSVARDVKRLSALSIGDPCPTCEQPIGPIVVSKLSAANSESTKSQAAMKEAEAETSRCRGVLEEADEWVAGERAAWKAEIKAIPRGVPQAPALEREIKQAERRLADLEGQLNPYQIRLEGEVKSAGELRRELKVAEAAVVRAKWVVQAAGAWQEALGPKGARAHMAEAALAAVESAANRWLSVLSDRGLAVEFPPTREVKGRIKEEIKTLVHIDDNGQDTVRDLLTFSGGERRRINLAVDLGVAAACGGGGLSLSLLVLDEEVFSGMDEEGKTAVVEALHSAGVADVVIIDHDPRLSSTLPRTIEVTRTKAGHSKLVEVKGP